MNALLFLVIAVAGGAGATARFMLDALIKATAKTDLPVGTQVINVSGSLALGVITGLALGGTVAEPWALVLGTGFLGGYTTFSTASYETLRLLLDGRPLASAANALGMLAAAVAAAALGLSAGMWLAA
ncbi:fluoride efflux transporter CrcB [Specibacter sp. NPDC057265]|uniref:fluoride efflux transporter CrcB n=1 Tax=Specibacter sp. NPDC057265 TaxID=3346075 RepID=UPI0036359453